MLIVGLITGILLIIIGNAMDKHERAERERFWNEYRRRR